MELFAGIEAGLRNVAGAKYLPSYCHHLRLGKGQYGIRYACSTLLLLYFFVAWMVKYSTEWRPSISLYPFKKHLQALSASQ